MHSLPVSGLDQNSSSLSVVSTMVWPVRCSQDYATLQAYTPANISALTSSWTRGSAFTLGCAGRDASIRREWPGSGVGLTAGGVPLHVICRHVWKLDI